MAEANIKEQLDLIRRGSAEIISEEELSSKIRDAQKNRRPLRIKAGFDPTAPDIHLGHTVLLTKLRQFQDMGHMVYLIIGDFTAQIGDPSGQDGLRPALSPKEIKANAATYQRQVFKILDKRKTKVVFNSEWFDEMSTSELIKLCQHTTVAQMIARADFKKRLSQNEDVSILEFMYPLLQAYDSVKLQADVELGGTDQKFNLLLGREFQKDFRQPSQVVIMMPLLEGLDGVKKMSKSLGNYIGVEDGAGDIFGKIMSISDELMLRYYELLTDESLKDVKSLHPMLAKKALAELLACKYWGQKEANKAKIEFEKTYQNGEFKEVEVKMGVVQRDVVPLIDLVDNPQVNLRSLLHLESKNNFRILISQGAVKVDGKKVDDINYGIVADGREYKVQIGPIRFAKIKLKKS
ncbi:tyrosine--tRNA ligase [Candidatus Omnitrophota bacterium]